MASRIDFFLVSYITGYLIICDALPAEHLNEKKRTDCVSCLRDCPEVFSAPAYYRRQIRADPTSNTDSQTTKRVETHFLENVQPAEKRKIIFSTPLHIESILRSPARPIFEINRHPESDRLSDFHNYRRSPRENSFVIYRVDDGFARKFSESEFENYVKHIVGASAPSREIRDYDYHPPPFTPKVRFIVHDNPFRINILKDINNLPGMDFGENFWNEDEEPILKHDKKDLVYTIENITKDSENSTKSSFEHNIESTDKKNDLKIDDTTKKAEEVSETEIEHNSDHHRTENSTFTTTEPNNGTTKES